MASGESELNLKNQGSGICGGGDQQRKPILLVFFEKKSHETTQGSIERRASGNMYSRSEKTFLRPINELAESQGGWPMGHLGLFFSGRGRNTQYKSLARPSGQDGAPRGTVRKFWGPSKRIDPTWMATAISAFVKSQCSRDPVPKKKGTKLNRSMSLHPPWNSKER